MPLRLHLDPDPALRVHCADVCTFDDALAKTVRALFDLMYAEEGRGLAAPQAGLGQRIFVMDPGWKEGRPAPAAFINPVILRVSDERQSMVEGCLSLPGRPRHISRPATVRLAWREVDGSPREAAFSGIEAVIVQHERDHLDGVLITDLPEAAEATA